jgi:ubiquitin carboxyl-terminal hydrolase 1
LQCGDNRSIASQSCKLTALIDPLTPPSICLTMAADHQLHDLFSGDPGIEQLQYHQDYRESLWWPHFARADVILPALFIFGAFVYQTLYLLDFDLLPLPEFAWNCLVYLTPYRLIDAVENYRNPLRVTNPAVTGAPRTHAEKSNAMRRMLGLDTGGIIGTVAQASRRRFSTLPGMKIGAHGADGRPAGLGNWDNSCYQNSVLQGLASLDSLSVYLSTPNSEETAIEEEPRPNMKMADALRGLISILNDPSNNGKRIWTPATLKSMSSWQQQDAQEYFSKVLDEIDKEVGQVVHTMRRSQGLETEGYSSDNATGSEPSQISTVRNPLEGFVAQRVGCMTCGYSEGLSMIPFNCLTVPLGKAQKYNISDCLNEYTELEFIEGVECGKCTLLKMEDAVATLLERVKDTPGTDLVRKDATERLAAITEALEEDDYDDKTLTQKCKIPPKSRVTSIKSRQAVIARPPRSLVVHFNRSLFDELTGELKKNYAEVGFPKILDLGPWCLGSSGTDADASVEEWLLSPNKSMIATATRPSRLCGPLYELRAVVTHYGRHENGHYICYKKHPTPGSDGKEIVKDQWWRLSDDDVMKVSEETVLGQGGVFMLFFDNIEPGATILPDAPLQSGVTTRLSDESELMVALRVPLPDIDETSSLYSTTIKEPTHESELTIASVTPLPDIDDSDISEGEERGSSLATCGESATSVSECEDDNDEHGLQDYKPAQAILFPPNIQKTGVHGEDGGAGQGGTVFPANMLMV